MALKTPIITSYRSVKDLLVLRDWFYPVDGACNNKWRAVQRVKALKTRGRLPHAIEVTALLTSVSLADPDTNSNEIPKHHDTNLLRMSYSMALIRFVNGLLDPYQQSTHAIPLHQLAKTLKLPGLFVEIRHMGTHEALPELGILREAVSRALNWLFEHYWSKLNENELETLEVSALDLEEELSDKDKLLIGVEVKKVTDLIAKLAGPLKTYKNLRKADLDLVFKRGQQHESVSKYYKAVDAIVNIYKDTDGNDIKDFNEKFMDILLFGNFLIYNDESKLKKKVKLNPLQVKLYQPLLEELGGQFKYQLLLRIIDKLTKYETDEVEGEETDDVEFEEFEETEDLFKRIVDEKLGFKIKKDHELIQLYGWIRVLLEDVVNFNAKKCTLRRESQSGSDVIFYKTTEVFDEIYQNVTRIENNERNEILRLMEELLTKYKIPGIASLLEKILKAIAKGNRNTFLETFTPPPTLNDILGVHSKADNNKEEPNNGKRKLDIPDTDNVKKTKSMKRYLFEVHEGPWVPVPFGEVP